jgi:hypothetical protein
MSEAEMIEAPAPVAKSRKTLLKRLATWSASVEPGEHPSSGR